MKVIEIWPNQIYQRGEFQHFPLAERKSYLARYGINSVLNVSPRIDALLADWMKDHYLHCPVPDSANIDFNLVEGAAAWALGVLLEPENRMLVHCHAGRNRSSLLSAILLMELHDMTGVEAIAHMQKVRPNALATGAFVDYLEQRPSRLLMGSKGASE